MAQDHPRTSQQYRLLDSDDDDTTKSTVPRFYEDRGWLRRLGGVLRTSFIATIAVLFGIGGFVIGSIYGKHTVVSPVSPYIKLSFDSPEILWWNTEFSNESVTDSELNRLWDVTIPWESGIIALENEEARKLKLPESQPFPWDASRKSLYINNAHHVLHCVRNLYISIQQYRTNKTQTINYPHILHCLDTLRVETMCAADDTLRYVPLNSAHNGFRPGDGQQRTCRNWDRVQEFVERHDPCYRYLKPGDTEISNLERFKFCPESTGYLPKIRKYFGYEHDWVPEPQEGPRELDW
ncbi:hypothetical protein F4678DRAFT_431029 [Xylaria arbuscula]|nr:hypothetical protein F4678DRAFT_431029 [Xylaria arbuscula]